MGTTPKGLWYPDGTDPISPIHPHLAAMQTSVDTALSGVRLDTPAGVHAVANAAGLTTLLADLTTAGYAYSSANPVYAYRADNQMLYRNIGAGWVEMSATLPAVRYNAQTLTSPQQTQARTNINAASQTDFAALQAYATPTIRVPGASGSWSWWYREIGDLVEVHVEYAASLAAGATATVASGIPSGLLPIFDAPLVAFGSGTQPAVARLGTSGAWTIRNLHSSAVALIIAHGIYTKP